MIHSLIPPRKKPMLNKFNRFCMYAVLLVCFLVSLFAMYLQLKNHNLKSSRAHNESVLAKVQEQNKTAMEYYDKKLKQTALIQNVHASNEVLKQSIKNLFDLIPDSIVLSEVLMEQKSLLIKGSTPTKEIFNTLLKTPLISIFASTKTSFYQQKSGWYNFTSINTIENSEGFNE